MAEYNHNKLYFLKLQKDYFHRHDILILEGMPNGKEYSLFYLKLMLESLDHDGYLRYNDLIPYNIEMLASVTNTNVDIVKGAIATLNQLGLLEILDDQTIYLRQVAKFTHETTIGAVKKQEQIERKDAQGGQKVENFPPEYRVKSIDNRVKSIDNKKENINVKENCRNDAVSPCDDKPAKHKYGKYNNILLTDDEHIKLLELDKGNEAIEWLSEYREMKGYKAKSDYLAIRKWVFTAMKEEEQKRKAVEKKDEKKGFDSIEEMMKFVDTL